VIDSTTSIPFGASSLNLNPGCNPTPMVNIVQSEPYILIQKAELEQLRAENVQLKQRIAELEAQVGSE